MSTLRGSFVRCGSARLAIAGCVLAVGCPEEDPADNVLPAADDEADDGDGDGDGDGDAGDGDGATGMVDGGDAMDGGDDGGAVTFPRSYRFTCVDIQIIGDGDGTAIQAGLLESTWTNDIKLYKLNIVLSVLARDDAAGTAMLQINSGVGTGDDDLCAQADTQSAEYPAGFDPMRSDWQASSEEKVCTEDAAGAPTPGTYVFELGPDDVVYIYAEDDDGTVFNCVPGGGAPDAVPVRAVQATVTMNADETVGYGNLTGCLTHAEASGLCSCLGGCVGNPNPNCAGCPDGSIPLAALLGGINPSDRCTEIMGEPAFDLQLGMITELLPDNLETCG